MSHLYPVWFRICELFLIIWFCLCPFFGAGSGTGISHFLCLNPYLVFCPRAYRIAKSWFSNCLCSFLDPTFMYEVLNLFKFPSVPGSLNIICSHIYILCVLFTFYNFSILSLLSFLPG